MERETRDKIAFWSNIVSGLYIVYLATKYLIELIIKVAKMNLVTIPNIIIMIIFCGSTFILIKDKIKNKYQKATKTTLKQNKAISNDQCITIRRLGDQVFQTINGKTLIGKWGIEPYHLLNIVKNQSITAYTPDEGVGIIANETEQGFEESMAFYSKKNEIDEDTVLRLKFKPQDIREFEEKVRNGLLPEYVLLRTKWKRKPKVKREDMKQG